MNELLCEILSICHKISVNSKADVFFNYMPHCDAYNVRVSKNGWTRGEASRTLTDQVESITDKNLKNTIAMLKAIAWFLEVEL